MEPPPRLLGKLAACLVLAAVLAFACSAAAQLTLTGTCQLGAVPLAPTWTVASGSLISRLAPTLARGNFGEYTGANANTLTAPGKAPNVYGYSSAPATNVCVAGNDGTAGALLVYPLPAAANGYNLTNITVYGGWQDAGRDAQNYTVWYSTTASPNTFNYLTSVSYVPANPAGTGAATRVAIADLSGAALAKNVAALEFDFTTPNTGVNGENGAAGYTVITVQGTASTTPPPPPPSALIQDTVPSYAATVVGDQVVFMAAFSNSPPANLQWLCVSGGVTNRIAGATNSTLTLNDVQPTNSGSYLLAAVNATNAAVAPAYSTAASLVVSSVPSATNGLILSPANQTGNGTGTFTPTWTIAGGSLIAGLQPSSVGAGNFNLYNAGGVQVLTDGQFGQVYPTIQGRHGSLGQQSRQL